MIMKIKKVSLVLPNVNWVKDEFNPITIRYIFPYSLISLAASLNKYYEVKIIDANFYNFSPDEFLKIISGFSPQVVGINCLTTEFSYLAHFCCKLVKREFGDKIVTIMGGYHPSLLPEEVLKDKNVDFVIIGEGEKRLPSLLKIIEKGDNNFDEIDGVAFRSNDGEIIIKKINSYIKNLDEIEFPAWGSIDFQRYTNFQDKFIFFSPKKLPHAQLFTSRGCPYNCSFCSKDAIGRYRFKSANRVLEEINQLVNEWNIKDILFIDDNLTANKERTIQLLKGIINMKFNITWQPMGIAVNTLDKHLLELMKESGCYRLTLALESGNNFVLKHLLNKQLTVEKSIEVVKLAKELQFEVCGFFLIGFPGETKQQIEETVKFAEDLDLDYTIFSIATPFPGTKLLEICKKNGYLIQEPSEVNFRGMRKGLIKTSEFDPEYLETMRKESWLNINFKNLSKKKRVSKIVNASLEEIDDWIKSV